MRRIDSDFPFFGDTECDALAAALGDVPRPDAFSVLPQGGRSFDGRWIPDPLHPNLIVVTIFSKVGGRTAYVELPMPRQMATEPRILPVLLDLADEAAARLSPQPGV